MSQTLDLAGLESYTVEGCHFDPLPGNPFFPWSPCDVPDVNPCFPYPGAPGHEWHEWYDPHNAPCGPHIPSRAVNCSTVGNPYRVVLSGPIGDDIESARQVFGAAALRLRNDGYDVWNPLEHYRLGDDYEDYIREAIAVLVTTHEAIVMMPGWKESKGASCEYHVARMIGLHTWEYVDGSDTCISAISDHSFVTIYDDQEAASWR